MSVSVGIVGLGQFGPSFIQNFKHHPDVDRLALCDLRADRLKRWAGQFEIAETYSSLTDACASDLDALFIMTQPWLHADHAVEAMTSGKHVYTAVPAAQTLDDCGRLVETVDQTGMVYMNGETSYFRPETAYCRQKAAEGAFGRFVHAEAEYMHDIDHGLRAVNQNRWGEQWSADKTGGIPMSYPTHSTCFIVSVMNAHMTSVSALGYRHPNDDWYRKDTIYENEFSNETALFEMSNGASARVCEYRRIGYPGCERASGIYGTEGSYEQNAAGAVWAAKHGTEPVHAPQHHEPLPEPLAANLGGHGGSHAYLVHEFVDSVNRERLPRINVWEAVRYAAPGLVAHESALREGERLPIPDFGDRPKKQTETEHKPHMKLQERIPLNQIYKNSEQLYKNPEEEFSDDLAEHLDALKVGRFEDAETEAKVGNRKADIVATGEDGTLVIENQFGKANWDHWGRLEAYARLKEADVAVLVAEEFEELMIDTCRLRDDADSSIDWYLIEAHANSHGELSFHHVVGPSKDIKTEKTAGGEESEFWAPIRSGEYGPLFAGKPVLRRNDAFTGKQTRSIAVNLHIANNHCYVLLGFHGNHSSEDKIARRAKVLELFSDQEGDFELSEPDAKYVSAKLPVLDKGRNNEEDWTKIREKLVQKGEELYNAIKDSGV